MSMSRFILLLAVLTASLFTISGCAAYKGEAKFPSGADRTTTGGDIYGKRD
jgi:hypothetical protein